MRRAERLFRIVNEMRTRPLSRAADLAAHFEVSLSTIYRDIAHLQASGLPIEGEAGVGYVLRPGFDLPNVTFTHNQIDALAIGLAFVERTGDPALAAAAAEVRAKIQAGLPTPEERALADAPFFSIQPNGARSSDTTLVRDAIRERRILDLCYATGEYETVHNRRVWPLVVWDMSGGWMFSAWCEMREDFRTFRWDRIRSLTATSDTFPDEDGRNLRSFMAKETCAV